MTPSVQYTLAKWVDALAEVDWGYKPNGNDVIETESRVGLSFHILSRLLADRGARRGAELEKQPLRRLVPSNLLRLEYENKDPLNGGATTTTWRLRDRQEISYPFNRKKLTADGAVYATGDVELFVLLGEASDPRFNDTACARALAIGTTSAGASKRCSFRPGSVRGQRVLHVQQRVRCCVTRVF